MRLFGFDIKRAQKAATLSGVDNIGWRSIFNFWPGQTWQNDVEVNPRHVTANWAVFSCMTLIAGDIGKVNLQLVKRQKNIWRPSVQPRIQPGHQQAERVSDPAAVHRAVDYLQARRRQYLRAQGARQARRRRRALHARPEPRDACSSLPMARSIYRLGEDDLSGLPNQMPAAPASEIIHDRMNCLFHPLVGLSPIYACGLAATQGLKIQNNSAKFFENMSRPSGVLTGPGEIKDETAKRMKDDWDENFGGDKIGRVAVLGDGLKYESMAINAVDSQMLEQLKATAEMVCSTFHVPGLQDRRRHHPRRPEGRGPEPDLLRRLPARA